MAGFKLLFSFAFLFSASLRLLQRFVQSLILTLALFSVGGCSADFYSAAKQLSETTDKDDNGIDKDDGNITGGDENGGNSNGADKNTGNSTSADKNTGNSTSAGKGVNEDSDGDSVIDLYDNCPRGATNWRSEPNTDYDVDGCRNDEDPTPGRPFVRFPGLGSESSAALAGLNLSHFPSGDLVGDTVTIQRKLLFDDSDVLENDSIWAWEGLEYLGTRENETLSEIRIVSRNPLDAFDLSPVGDVRAVSADLVREIYPTMINETNQKLAAAKARGLSWIPAAEIDEITGHKPMRLELTVLGYNSSGERVVDKIATNLHIWPRYKPWRQSMEATICESHADYNPRLLERRAIRALPRNDELCYDHSPYFKSDRFNSQIIDAKWSCLRQALDQSINLGNSTPTFKPEYRESLPDGLKFSKDVMASKLWLDEDFEVDPGDGTFGIKTLYNSDFWAWGVNKEYLRPVVCNNQSARYSDPDYPYRVISMKNGSLEYDHYPQFRILRNANPAVHNLSADILTAPQSEKIAARNKAFLTAEKSLEDPFVEFDVDECDNHFAIDFPQLQPRFSFRYGYMEVEFETFKYWGGSPIMAGNFIWGMSIGSVFGAGLKYVLSDNFGIEVYGKHEDNRTYKQLPWVLGNYGTGRDVPKRFKRYFMPEMQLLESTGNPQNHGGTAAWIYLIHKTSGPFSHVKSSIYNNHPPVKMFQSHTNLAPSRRFRLGIEFTERTTKVFLTRFYRGEVFHRNHTDTVNRPDVTKGLNIYAYGYTNRYCQTVKRFQFLRDNIFNNPIKYNYVRVYKYE